MTVPPGEHSLLDRRVGRSAFGRDAGGYHASRSGYPAELFDYLAQRAPPQPRVLEIGAGTGLASEGLLALSPVALTIIEPDPRLCGFLEQRFSGERVRVVCGVFPDADEPGPFDLIACAAAFHWMEPDAALARILSLLAPGGTWAMWWNAYFGLDMGNPFAARVTEVLVEEGVCLPPSYDGLTHYSLDTDRHIRTLCEAGFDNVEHVGIRTERSYDAAQAADLFASFSFAGALADEHRAHLLGRIRRLVDEEFGGLARGCVATSLYSGSAPPTRPGG